MISWDVAFLIRLFWVPLKLDVFESRRAFTVIWEKLHRKYSVLIPSTSSSTQPHVYESTTGQWEPWCTRKSSCPLWFSKLLVMKEGSSKWMLVKRVMKLRSTFFHFILRAFGSNTKCLCSHTKVEQKLPLYPHWTCADEVERVWVPSLHLAFVWGQMFKTNRKQWLERLSHRALLSSPWHEIYILISRGYLNIEIPKFGFTCFGIFLLTSYLLCYNSNFCKPHSPPHSSCHPEGINLLKPTLSSATHIPVPRRLRFLH